MWCIWKARMRQQIGSELKSRPGTKRTSKSQSWGVKPTIIQINWNCVPVPSSTFFFFFDTFSVSNNKNAISVVKNKSIFFNVRLVIYLEHFVIYVELHTPHKVQPLPDSSLQPPACESVTRALCKNPVMCVSEGARVGCCCHYLSVLARYDNSLVSY